MTPNQVPRARSANLLLEDVDDDVVVYNTATDEAHLLNAVTASVWKACDGRRTVDLLATELGFHRDVVVLALNELTAAGLLEVPVIDEGITRRRVLKAIGAAALLPTVLTIAAAPAAAVTAGVCPSNCNGNSDCDKTGCGQRKICCGNSASPTTLRNKCVVSTNGRTGSNQTCSN